MAIPNCVTYTMSFRVTCYVIIIIHAIIFMCSFFPFLLTSTGKLAHLQQSPVPLQFPLPDVITANDATPLIGPFIFRDLGYFYQLMVPGQVPCVGLILPCRNFRLLP